MILDKTPVTRHASNDDNLIPLINVVFLMLIFFMVAGQIQPSDGVEVEPPTSLNETDAESDLVKLIISSDEALFINGKQVSETEFEQHLQHYLASVDTTKAKNIAVQIKADSHVTLDRLQQVVMMIKDSGVTEISLITQSEATANDN